MDDQSEKWPPQQFTAATTDSLESSVWNISQPSTTIYTDSTSTAGTIGTVFNGYSQVLPSKKYPILDLTDIETTPIGNNLKLMTFMLFSHSSIVSKTKKTAFEMSKERDYGWDQPSLYDDTLSGKLRAEFEKAYQQSVEDLYSLPNLK